MSTKQIVFIGLLLSVASVGAFVSTGHGQVGLSGNGMLIAQNTTEAQTIVVSEAWAKATPPGKEVTAGFLNILNSGEESVRLVGGASSCCKQIAIHEMFKKGDAMKMRAVRDGLLINAGQTVALKPGGYHVMLIGLKNQLNEGDEVLLTLKFSDNHEVKVTLRVLPADSKSYKSD